MIREVVETAVEWMSENLEVTMTILIILLVVGSWFSA